MKPVVAMDAFQEHTLGPEANEYVRDVLEYGHSLARHLRRSRDLTDGRVVTRLAPDANTDELGKFKWGGKYYPEPISGRRRTPVDDLASYILGYLETDEERVCVFENYLARRTDPWLVRAESRVLFLGEEVYHIISTEDADPSLVKATINEADYFPVFVGILASWPEGSRLSPERRDITDEELRALAEKAEKIIVSAYDGEAYLIWGSPRPQAPSEILARVLGSLATGRRELFLAALIYWLTMAARGEYVEAANEHSSALSKLRCHNELAMVVAKQLSTYLGAANIGYPDKAFVEVLLEKSELGGCRHTLLWSLEKALKQVTPDA